MFNFVRRRLPEPGAGVNALLPFQALPQVSILGSGTACGQPPSPLQPMQIVADHYTLTSGYGGLQAGYLRGQPLIYIEGVSQAGG
jgi:hypothetical protein